jgi:hypothetical protein
LKHGATPSKTKKKTCLNIATLGDYKGPPSLGLLCDLQGNFPAWAKPSPLPIYMPFDGSEIPPDRHVGIDVPIRAYSTLQCCFSVSSKWPNVYY